MWSLSSGVEDDHFVDRCHAGDVRVGRYPERTQERVQVELGRRKPSGIRIGTAALTTRGMKQDEMKKVGAWILSVLRAPEDAAVIERVRGEIQSFCKAFPVPGIG